MYTAVGDISRVVEPLNSEIECSRNHGHLTEDSGGTVLTKVYFIASVFVIALTSLWNTAQLSFAQDFYAGKTIRINVGFPAGGGFDTYSRIIGRHIGKFIPGNPAVVVDNVTGAVVAGLFKLDAATIAKMSEVLK